MGRLAAARAARDLLGVPVLPPGPASVGLSRVRAGFGFLRRRSGPAPVQLLETVLSIADNRVVGLLVELDVAEHLTKPMTASELADRCDVRTEPLERVLRYASVRGFVGRRGQRYRPNAVTERLRRDHPGSWHGWAEFATSDWYWDAWRGLGDVVRGDASTGLGAATGHDFFDYVHDVRPEAGDAFDRAMAAGGRLHGLCLAGALDWDGVRSVCDVGGGTGATLDGLLTRHGDLRATVVDLAPVVAKVPASSPVMAVAGDFFDSVPIGHDRYLLIAVVHDWNDEDAVRILRTVRAAMTERSRVVVVENVRSDRPKDEFALLTDIQMMALSPGRERTRDEYRTLAGAAGLRLVDETVLASGATAMTLAPA